MGLLNLIPGFEKNPFGQWWNQNENFRGALATGFASGKDFNEGLANAAQMGPAGRQLDKSEAERQAELAKAEQAKNATLDFLQQKHPDLAAAFNAGAPMQSVWAEAMNRMTPKKPTVTDDITEYNFAKQNGFAGTFPEWMATGKGAQGGVQYGVTPVYGKDAQGNIVVLQAGDDGSITQPQMPNGVTPLGPYGVSAQKAGGAVDAKTAANARAALPGAQQVIDITMKATDTLLKDTKGMAENFGSTLFVPNQLTPTMPGTAKANFWNNVQAAQGDAFLQARQWLKGQGAITEFESYKAETAMSQIEAAAKSGNEAAFKRAVMDFQDAVRSGYEKLVQTAEGGFSAGDVPSLGQQNPGGADPLGIR